MGQNSNAFARGKLGSSVPSLMLVGGLALSWTLFAVSAPNDSDYEINLLVVAVVGIIFFTLGLFGLAVRVEGRRRAVDRLATILVTLAFFIALTPLISLIITVVSKATKSHL